MSPEVSDFFQRLNSYSASNIYDVVREVDGTPPIAEISRLPKFLIGRPLAETISELESYSAELLSLPKIPFRERIELFRRQLNNVVLRVAIVGQIKAGKTSVINALSGRSEFLPTHVNPWTAVPTQLYFGVKGRPESGADFEFFSDTEWRRLGNAIIAPVTGASALRSGIFPRTDGRPDWRRAALRIGDQFQHLLGYSHHFKSISPRELAQYLCAGPPVHEQSRQVQPGRYADITKVADVYLPREPFACPTIVVDTPGLNDPSFIRLKATENILEEADIYIVILSANQPMSLADITLLRRLRGLDKRRFLILINRCDELAGQEAVDLVRNHVEGRLRAEFPNMSIPVLPSSAYWANVALSGTDEEANELATGNHSRSWSAEGKSAAPNRAALINLNAQRERIFRASGFAKIIETLSLLMRDSFVSSQGMGVIKNLQSSVDLTLSNARRELASVRPMKERPVANFTLAFAQVEKRLKETEAVRANANEIIDAAHQQIGSVLKNQTLMLRPHLEAMILDFAEHQKALFRRGIAEKNAKSWHCDMKGILGDLETEFLQRFSAALELIADSHDECVATVKRNLEQSHSKDAAGVSIASGKTPPDIRPYLPALGRSIEIDVGGSWRIKWWSKSKLPEQKCDELKRKIVETLMPIAERLVLLAENELTAFADEARALVSEAVGTTIDSTIARLNELKDRLSCHMRENPYQPNIDQGYEKNIEELTSLIAACEPLAAQLARMKARIG